MPNGPGNLSWQMPPRDDDAPRKQRDLERAQREQASALTAAATQIGSGGLLVNGGGSITISGTGSLNVGSGALNSAGSITAGTTITAGGNITSTGGALTVAGGITGGGLNVGSGSIAGGAISGTSVTSSSGDVSTPGSLRGADLFATNAPGFNITGTRVAAWLESATGRLGMATSSSRFKTNIVDAGIDPLAVLSISVKHYNYIAEVASGEADPRHKVHLEVGAIAEDLHAAGLWEFVIYERDEDGNPVLAAGQLVPLGIHYDMLALAVLTATQHVWAQHQALEARVAALEAR